MLCDLLFSAVIVKHLFLAVQVMNTIVFFGSFVKLFLALREDRLHIFCEPYWLAANC